MANSNRGRKSKPHRMANGEDIKGLYHRKDKRWRIVKTGKIFSAKSEDEALKIFRAWEAENKPQPVIISTDHEGDVNAPNVAAFLNSVDADLEAGNVKIDGATGKVKISLPAPPAILWPWLADMLTNQPELIAKMTGVQAVAGLRYLPLPRPSLKLASLLETYKTHADVKRETKEYAANIFEIFLKKTHATTLDDLKTETLTAYREDIISGTNSVGSTNGPGTVACYFGIIKNVIRFAKTEGMDAIQIDTALSRLAVLKAPKDRRAHQPTPVMPQRIILATERLLLRDFVEDDWQAVHEYAVDPEVVRFMDWGPNTEQQTKDFVARTIGHRHEEPRRAFELAVVLKDSNRLIGGCGLRISRPEHHCGDFGYTFHRQFWGHGYATEASREIVRFGFDVCSLHRIFATCDAQNAGSAHVLEKLGMRRESHFLHDKWQREQWRDSFLYAILVDEWKARKAKV